MDNPKHKVSILMPTAYRPERLKLALATLHGTLDREQPQDVEVLLSCVSDDPDSLKLIQLHGYQYGLWIRTPEQYRRGAIWAFNELARFSTGDVLVDVDDDQFFHDGWLTNSLRELDKLGGHGLVAFNDLRSDGNEYAAHFLVSRSFLLQHMGGVLWPPMYVSWWCDREMSDKAKAAGCYAWAKDAIVEHRHWSFGQSELDQTYRDGRAFHDSDRLLYEQRKRDGYPITWEPILAR